jgi:hypothetical protein
MMDQELRNEPIQAPYSNAYRLRNEDYKTNPLRHSNSQDYETNPSFVENKGVAGDERVASPGSPAGRG